jgi:hypothetical protein
MLSLNQVQIYFSFHLGRFGQPGFSFSALGTTIRFGTTTKLNGTREQSVQPKKKLKLKLKRASSHCDGREK